MYPTELAREEEVWRDDFSVVVEMLYAIPSFVGACYNWTRLYQRPDTGWELRTNKSF